MPRPHDGRDGGEEDKDEEDNQTLVVLSFSSQTRKWSSWLNFGGEVILPNESAKSFALLASKVLRSKAFFFAVVVVVSSRDVLPITIFFTSWISSRTEGEIHW